MIPSGPAGHALTEPPIYLSTCITSPAVMGILNVTPDSFSDGGDFLDPTQALAHAMHMVRDGAAIIDVGPESTRPGAPPVDEPEQIARAVPVIRRLQAADLPCRISIDTRSAAVARAALDAGASMINDVSALRDDPDMVRVAARASVPVVLMHRKGSAQTMQEGGGPGYDDLLGEIVEFLRERIAWCHEHGIPTNSLIVDPGIGFGKRIEHNLLLIRSVRKFSSLGTRVLYGVSRKRFIGAVMGEDDPASRPERDQRLAGSLTCALLAALQGVSILRVHDVRPTVEALRMAAAVAGAEPEGDKP